MFAHSNQSSKYFSHYGVKLDANKDSKLSYVNAIIQLLVNIDKEFAREIFASMYDYKGEDRLLKAFTLAFEQIREVLQSCEGKGLLDSDISIGKTPPKLKESKTDGHDQVPVLSFSNDLIKLYTETMKEDVRWKGDANKQCFLDTFLYKCHQLFKSELEVSFQQFSVDNTCACYSHKYFSMACRDKIVATEQDMTSSNRFSIVISIEAILEKMKKEGLNGIKSLSTIENNLFYFYQNLRLSNKLTDETSERSLAVLNEETDNFMTFKLDLGEKTTRDDKYSFNLGLLLSLIPQYLSGDEFSYVDNGEAQNSPRGQLCGIVAFNKASKTYTTYVDVECIWTMFSNKHTKQLHFYENVVDNMLSKGNFPLILFYVKCSSSLQRNNQQVSDSIKNYLDLLCSGHKYKEEFKAATDQEEFKEDSKGEISLATSTENHINSNYKNRRTPSLISKGDQPKTKKNKDKMGTFCCWGST